MNKIKTDETDVYGRGGGVVELADSLLDCVTHLFYLCVIYLSLAPAVAVAAARVAATNGHPEAARQGAQGHPRRGHPRINRPTD